MLQLHITGHMLAATLHAMVWCLMQACLVQPELTMLQESGTWFPNLLKLVQVAFVGFVVQALVVRSNGPIDDLTTHLSNPFGEAVIASFADVSLSLP